MTPQAGTTAITFERTHDMALVRSIATHPAIWPHISDDGCGSPDDWQPVDHAGIWYMLVRADGDLLGLWMFAPENSVTVDVHTCLLPEARGPRAADAARQMTEWMWANSPFRRIVTRVPVYNRLALRFAKRAGMTEYGVNPQSYLKNGELMDQVLLGISKP